MAAGEGVRFLAGDLAEPGSYGPALSAFRPDACVHAAWEGIPDFSPAVTRRNVACSLDLVDRLADASGCWKIVGIGSCAEYRNLAGVLREDDPVGAAGFLGWGKGAVDGYGRLRCAAAGVTWIWLRLFYAYGPRQRGGSLLPTLFSALAEGRPLPVRNPFNANDLVHVDDVAAAVVRAVEGDAPSGAYNLGSGVSTPVIDVCAIAERGWCGSTERTDALRASAAREDATDFRADITKIREALGWSPVVPLADGIGRCRPSKEREGTP
jgi:nucleoside-diphosphate-sugar epimerase